MTTLLCISGSLRRNSYNRKLAAEAARLFAPETAIVADLRLPLYDGDLETEQGIPSAVQLLADQIRAADAVVIATPEYNKGPSGVLKNALDWVSRTKGWPWRDKPVAIMSATGGRAGGERSQFALRLFLTPFRAHVLPGPEVLVGNAEDHFNAEGRLVTESYVKALTELMADLKRLASS